MRTKTHRIVCIVCMLVYTLALYSISATDSLYKAQCDSLNIPILYIVTENGVMPTYTVVYAPEGCSGRGITNNEPVPAHMWIILEGDTLLDTGDFVKGSSGVTIKVRGNTTASDNSLKKPYKLKLQTKADLLFRGNEAVYADKDWVLLRDHLCATMVGNMTNRALGMKWTPAQTPVFLFLNDHFQGLYMLTENVKRNTKCRVDVDKTGFLYEFDAYWWNEDFHIDSHEFGPRINYTLKYPDSEDILPWQGDYLTNHINKVENAFITSDALDSAIDIHSYARWLWVHDMLGNSDGAGSNLFIAKNDTTALSKQEMICAWDFDGCFTPDIQWSEVHHHFWFRDFFTLPQKQFVQEYIDMYDSVVKDVFDQLVNDIHALRQTEQIATLDSAFVMDGKRWDSQHSANKQLEDIANYLTHRKHVVENMMVDLKDNYIFTTLPEDTYRNTYGTSTYDVLGRPVPENSNGLIMIRRNSDGSVQKLMR